MSHIHDLINELCPDGVVHYPMGKVGDFIRGNGLQKKDLREEGVGAIHYGQVFTHYGTATHETKSFVEPELAQKLRRARQGDLVIATTSENDEDVCKAVAWLGDAEVAVSGDAHIFRHSMSPKYVAYFFQSQDFQNQKRRFISGTKVRRVSGRNLEKINVPVPPLEVQDEIVRVLDTFSALTAELEAELEARRAQYEDYRNALLRDGGPPEKVSLGEIARIGTGAAVSKKAIDANPGSYPVINSGRDPLGFIDKFNTVDDPIGVTSRGAGVGSITWCGGAYFRGNLNYSVTVLDPQVVNVRYLYYALLNSQRAIQRLCTFQGIPALNKVNLEKLSVTLPPLEQQEATATRLDKFDALVSDLTSGLPAEIEARRKQYEYYRDRLLTFEEAPA